MNAARALTQSLLSICAGLVFIAGCASAGGGRQARDDRERTKADIVFHIVRHAEKAATPANDPALSETGQARARRLADSLRDQPPTAIYATDYARTRATAAPTAERYGRKIVIYDAHRPETEFVDELLRHHVAGDVVLVVGHSNTVAPIAGALCRCEIPPLRDDEYDRWLTIRIAPNGVARPSTAHY